MIFIPHILSDQSTRWGIMELELYSFVICVRQLSPYLLRKRFTVKTIKILYVSREFEHSKIGPLESATFRVQISRRVQNVVAEGLTRVISLSTVEIPKSKGHMFVEEKPSDLLVRRRRNDGSRNLRRH